MQQLAQLAIEGDFDRVRLLATPHLATARDKSGRTLLIIAADAAWTPLQFAKCIEYFIYLGADPIAAAWSSDCAGDTVAHVAARQDHLRMLALLEFEAKWLLNAAGRTPLMEAAEGVTWSCVKHLLHLLLCKRRASRNEELLGHL